MYKLGYQLILPRIYIVLVVAFSFQVVIHAHAFASLINYKANQSDKKKGKKMACAYLCAQEGTSESIFLWNQCLDCLSIYFHYYMLCLDTLVFNPIHMGLDGLICKLV